MEHFIHAKNLQMTFNSNSSSCTALDDFNLNIKKHEFLSIIGPSGCGKTTFLRILAGLIQPNSGEVTINGTKVANPGPDRAMVFQEIVLMPWRNTLRNVMFGIEMKKGRMKGKARAMDLIKLVGLEGFEMYYPDELSGGMRQRVGIARALAVDPETLLMDEPFGSLDAQTRENLQDELLRIWEIQRKTVVFSTHSIEEAIYLSDRIAVMTPRPGKVKEIVKVTLSRPREYSQKMSAEFTELRRVVWNLMKKNR